jgi:hypothetical protein
VNLNRLGAAARAAIVVCAVAATLAGCSSDSDALANKVAGELPDLTADGLTTFECGSGQAIGGSFQSPADPYVAQCWKGSPDKTFQDVANSVADDVALATGGQNVTSDVCPDDALSAAGGIACRAALVTDGDQSVLVRTVVVLADPETVLKDLSENPTQDQINEAVTGAAVEVLVGTQSPTEPASSPTTSAS